jgi:hypothetical protein
VRILEIVKEKALPWVVLDFLTKSERSMTTKHFPLLLMRAMKFLTLKVQKEEIENANP